MDVAGRRETGAAVILGERHRELARGRVQNGARVDHPVVLGCVAIEVGRVREDAREIGERVLCGRNKLAKVLAVPARQEVETGKTVAMMAENGVAIGTPCTDSMIGIREIEARTP